MWEMLKTERDGKSGANNNSSFFSRKNYSIPCPEPQTMCLDPKPCAFIQLLDQIIFFRKSLLLGKYHTKTKRNKEGRSIEKNESLVIASKFGICCTRHGEPV